MNLIRLIKAIIKGNENAAYTHLAFYFRDKKAKVKKPKKELFDIKFNSHEDL